MATGGADPPSPTGGAPADPPAASSASAEAGAGTSPQHHSNLRRDRDRLTHLFLTLGKLLGVVVTLVTLVGGVVTVLFQVDPTLEPCVGGAGLTFTAVDVVPDYLLPQYMSDINNGNVPSNVSNFVGAEVRYNYSTSNLSGNDLRLYLTLQQIEPDGDIAALPGPPPGVDSPTNLQSQVGVPGQPPNPVTPDRCSEASSGLDWIQLPPPAGRHRRYRIVLEFYRGALDSFSDRVGVSTTPIFDY
jgi:hypothetical protein